MIDFGRADLRAPHTDLTRLAAAGFRGAPDLEDAFLDGYGDAPASRRQGTARRCAKAIGTAAWALRVGDLQFEAQGHRMIAEALDGVG